MPWNPITLDSEILAVHAALLPIGDKGQVLLFGGDEHWGAQDETQAGEKFKKTKIHDIDGNTIDAVESPDSDVFCAGHAFLADGRLIIGGGTSEWPEADIHDHGLDFLGHRRCWIFNPNEKLWIESKRMSPQPGREADDIGGGRWYPTLTTLGNGEVIAFFGHLTQEDTRHRNTTPEKYNASSNQWSLLPQMAKSNLRPGSIPNPAFDPDQPVDDVLNPERVGSTVRYLMYPRCFLLPNGNLFFATPMPVEPETDEFTPNVYNCTFYNPQSGNYEGPSINRPGGGWSESWNMPAVILPLLPENGYKSRVLVCGGSTNRIIDLDVDNPAWVDTGARTGAAAGRVRSNSIATILPTGEVLHSGGVSSTSPENPVLEPELYDPSIDWATGQYTGIGSWTSKEAASIARNYHSTALLLPDGRVWTAGGNTNAESGDPDGNANPDADGVVKKRGAKTIEFYNPDYIGNANQPNLNSAPKSIAYGERFTITSDQAAQIERVALIRNSSVTHGNDYDQRYVGLRMEGVEGNTISLIAPPNGNIAPPGYYTLWVINDAGLPCRMAKFVRMAHQFCEVITDRSTFSNYEVEAILDDPMFTEARFENALYVIFENFIPNELGLPGSTPTSSIVYAADGVTEVPGMSLQFKEVLYEEEPVSLDVPQRVTIVYDVRFINQNAFNFPEDDRDLVARITLAQHICSARLNLIKAPNPYMRDSLPNASGEYNPHWLSTDVRVFQIKEFQTLAGTAVSQGTAASAPFDFIQGVMNDFNGKPENDSHPFLSISDDQQNSKLELARFVSGKRVYNYAVAKVRFRANAIPPGTDQIRLFFRMFKTASSSMRYNTGTTYRRNGNGPSAMPLLGLVGGEVVTIPFFASARVNTSSQSMTDQSDPPNAQDFTAGGSTEQTLYFGCWLDINQEEEHFPFVIADTNNNGPFSNRKNITQHIRGEHQCLVAEIHFIPDPINPNAKPGESDNLSQRNLAIVDSDNPGGPATHTVQHTFEVSPTPFNKEAYQYALGGGEGAQILSSAAKASSRFRFDELMIRWYNIPRDSQVLLFFSDVDVDEILAITNLRTGPSLLTKIDEHTISCTVQDITYIPIPGGRTLNIPAMISVRLPDNVVKGQHYHASVHQVSGFKREIIGAFELSIPVRVAADILPAESRKYSVMQYIANSIPPTDHWYPIMQRYIQHMGDRVDGLGGNSNQIFPNPDGTGKDPLEKFKGLFECPGQWILALIIALVFLLLILISNPIAIAVIAVVGLITGIAAYQYWCRDCRPGSCQVLQTIQLGLLTALGIMSLLNLLGVVDIVNQSYWLVLILIIACIQVYLFVRKCNCPEDLVE